MPYITLTTDFGQKDGFVGVLKGVIWRICPKAQIADISHEIAPQNILEGAFALWRAYRFFPPGTVHVAVIDPGVGTQRRLLAAKIGIWFFVGPDNGLFTRIYKDAKLYKWSMECVHLVNENYFLPQVSHTFHGRDIFAPIAAHLANGVALSKLGPILDNPVQILIPEPEKTPKGWRVHVIGIDRFGNLITNMPTGWIEEKGNVHLRAGRFDVHGVADSYGAYPPGKLIALTSSDGQLELAVVNGSAAHITGMQVGDILEVIE
jgi:S-adenosylmethionine hydrolase